MTCPIFLTRHIIFDKVVLFLTHHIIFDNDLLLLTLAKSETKLKIIDRSTDLRRTVYHEKSSIKYNKLSFDMEFPEIFGA